MSHLMFKRAQPAKGVTAVLLIAATLAACSENRGRTRQMYPDCDQVSAEEQREGQCMIRPDTPVGR
jgi:hypothetical protein